MDKLTLITAKSKDGSIWGRIQYGEDLLTANEKTEEELIAAFIEQFEGFYNLKYQTTDFSIQFEESIR